MIPLPDGSCADSTCLCPLSLLAYGHVLFFPKHIRETAVPLRISAVSHVIGATRATD